jgi:hypothetical protein
MAFLVVRLLPCIRVNLRRGKIINQLLVGVHAQAACEALALAEKMSLEVPLLQEMLASSWGQSRVLELVLADYQRLRREGNGWKGRHEE